MKKPNLQEFLLNFSGPKRPVDRLFTLIWLQGLGFTVPDFGLINELVKECKDEDQLVAWLPYGNVKMSASQAKRFPNDYAVKYVGQHGAVSTSTKYVQIGKHGYWVDIHSRDNWQANKGDCKAELVKLNVSYHPLIELPFFSIDYCRSDAVYAIDFDYEPKNLRNYGLQNIVTPKVFRDLYRNAVRHFEKPKSELHKKVGEALESFPRIKFYVEDSNVHLYGTLKDSFERNKLYETVARVEGAKRMFVNKIKVLSAS